MCSLLMKQEMKAVNCTRQRSTHYVGRKESIRSALGDPADCSALGNPFKMNGYSDEERTRVIREYKGDLWAKIKNRSGETYEMIKSLPEDAVLGCFCKPKACHCDVIIAAYAWIRDGFYPPRSAAHIPFSERTPMDWWTMVILAEGKSHIAMPKDTAEKLISLLVTMNYYMVKNADGSIVRMDHKDSEEPGASTVSFDERNTFVLVMANPCITRADVQAYEIR